MKTIEYLDLVKAAKSITSDYQLAKTLGISTARLSSYRNGRYDMDELLALKVENILNMPSGSVLLDIQANRTKCPEAAKVLQAISKKLAAGILSLCLCFSMALQPEQARAGQNGPFNDNIHYAYLK